MKALKALLVLATIITFTGCGTPCLDGVEQLSQDINTDTYELNFENLSGGLDADGNAIIHSFIKDTGESVILHTKIQTGNIDHGSYKFEIATGNIEVKEKLPVYSLKDTPEECSYIHIYQNCINGFHYKIMKNGKSKDYRVSKLYDVDGNIMANIGTGFLAPIAFVGDVAIHIAYVGLMVIACAV